MTYHRPPWTERAASRGSGTRVRRLGDAALLIGLGLAAFWLLPLLAHLSLARPLAWGDPDLASLGRTVIDRPLIGVLAAANLAGWIMRGRGMLAGAPSIWLLALSPLMMGLIVTDLFLGSTLGLLCIPADRLVDSLYLALILGAAVSLGAAARRLARVPGGALGLAALAVTLPLAGGSPEPTLSLLPGGRRQWCYPFEDAASGRAGSYQGIGGTREWPRILFRLEVVDDDRSAGPSRARRCGHAERLRSGRRADGSPRGAPDDPGAPGAAGGLSRA